MKRRISLMTRDEIKTSILEIMNEEFEIENPGLDDDLREIHNFDSIDAISLLEILDEMMDPPLTQDEKKAAMTIKSINEIIDYAFEMLSKRKG